MFELKMTENQIQLVNFEHDVNVVHQGIVPVHNPPGGIGLQQIVALNSDSRHIVIIFYSWPLRPSLTYKMSLNIVTLFDSQSA